MKNSDENLMKKLMKNSQTLKAENKKNGSENGK